jgi:hypothetical protein
MHPTRFQPYMVVLTMDIPGELAIEGYPARTGYEKPGFVAKSTCCIKRHQKVYRKLTDVGRLVSLRY